MSKKPTGIVISREKMKYTVVWKCGDSNYSGGQKFQYRINDGKWESISISGGARKKTISLDADDYNPTKEKVFEKLTVRIKGKKSGSKWSDWSVKTYKNGKPDVPELTAELDSQLTNKTTFTWDVTTEDNDKKPFYHTAWETMLLEECDITDGSDLVWESSQLGWETGSGTRASSKYIEEDTSLLANSSYTRWFRARARGAGGDSSWRYEKHVYARPYQAQIIDAYVANTDAEGIMCFVEWTADATPSHPIDSTTVQYLITVPGNNLSCPSGAQWDDANISADTKDTDAARFSIDNVLGDDECLFVRVNTIHDSNTTHGIPHLASIGNLADPSDLSYTPDNVDHTLTSVSVENNSDVPDSFIVLVYRAGSNPDIEIPIGIIPHGASQPLVTPVVCPNWSGETAFSIGAYTAVGTYESNTDFGYTVNAKMRSATTVWVGGAVPVAPENVSVMQSQITKTATITWDWTWAEANYAQISWTDHPDAWESTDEPEIYTVNKVRATRWNVSGLDLGVKWYFAVRLVKGNPADETAIYGPWSDLTDIILSSVPNIPTLKLSSSVITVGKEITASWDFISTDGSDQIGAEIKDENDNLIAHTSFDKEVVIDTEALGWEGGETHSLSVRVTSSSNRTTEWSNPVSIVVAEPLECEISSTSLEDVEIEVDETTRTVLSLTELPLTIEFTGITKNVTTTVSIERSANYSMNRPDESEFEGFEGEIVYISTQNTANDIIINQSDLIGYLDDEAEYRVFVTFKDVYGQVKNNSIEFEVHWSHQAVIPEAEIEIDDENLIAILRPIAPTGTLTGDTCDIYRLSADKPELIVRDAEFGVDYVDPYPAIGTFGGHRFVFKTVNGDYITENNEIAWIDTGESDGDILDVDRTIIDFDGNQLLLYYNVDVGHSWDKDFQQTKYLGGSIQGDWNAGVDRGGSVSVTMLTLTDKEQIRLMKRLAEYTGPCHIRTKDGSSFTADIQVSEDMDHADYDAITSFSLTITRIDSETLDGVLYSQWS